MSRARVAVLGASGFVGSAVCRRLAKRPDLDVRAFVRTLGNAWGLLPLPVTLSELDLHDERRVEEALKDVDYVVNCSRGEDNDMIVGLRNVLRVGRRASWRRFVHLSSVAVYGDPPAPETVRETAAPSVQRGTYGWVKLEQDNMVRDACKAGLKAVVLCPPNIAGPHSYFLLQVLGAMRTGGIALVDDGNSPCCVVDVENLAHAIECALERGSPDGSRYFVTDDGGATWRDIVDALQDALARPAVLRSISRGELTQMIAAQAPKRISPVRTLKYLISAEVRQVLRKDPGLAAIDSAFRRIPAFLGAGVEDRIRRNIYKGAQPNQVVDRGVRLNVGLCAQQLRGVHHSSERAKNDLGYEPRHSTNESTRAFVRWYRERQGLNSDYGSLLRFAE